MKLFVLILGAIACIVYAIMWYLGETVPAWQALIWAFLVFVDDFADYLDEKL